MHNTKFDKSNHLKLIAMMFVFSFSNKSFADVDLVCQNNCTVKGYSYQYCAQACSYNDANNEAAKEAARNSLNPWGGLNKALNENKQIELKNLEIEHQKLENERLRLEIERRKNGE